MPDALPDSVTRVLDRYRFVRDDAGTRWHFTGHPSQCTTICLSIDAAGHYVLSIEELAGGEGYYDELVFAREQTPALVAEIEVSCEAALEPYVKTRLQRWFEPWIGHDAAWALFHRKARRRSDR